MNQGEGTGKDCDQQRCKINKNPVLKEGEAQHKRRKRKLRGKLEVGQKHGPAHL